MARRGGLIDEAAHLGLATLTLLIGGVTAGRAHADITYSVDDYPSLQVGFATGEPVHISGSITTDGTLGTGLSASSVITSWNIIFSQGVYSDSFSGTGAGAAGDITTTATDIYIDPAFGLASPQFNIEWGTTGTYANYDQNYGLVLEWNTNTISDFLPPNPLPIATVQSVPELSTFFMSTVGIGSFAGFFWWRRKSSRTPQ